jgi:hypothetical protein
MADDSGIAEDFMAVAQDAADTWARQKQDKLRQKFGAVYDDYAGQLEPVITAIGRLSHKDDCRFFVSIPSPDARDFRVTLKYTVPAALTPFTNELELTVFDGKGKVTAAYSHQYDQRTHYDRSEQLENFAEARRKLAYWFASVAPDRLPELQDLLLPRQSVVLKRDMTASQPIRLKTAETP